MRPVRFTFEGGPEFAGFTDGTTWNGWPNVWVTPDERDRIVAWFRAEPDDDTADELARATIISDMTPPLVSLANGYTPTLCGEISQDPPSSGPWAAAPGAFGAVGLTDRRRAFPLRLTLTPGKFCRRPEFDALCARIVDALNATEA